MTIGTNMKIRIISKFLDIVASKTYQALRLNSNIVKTRGIKFVDTVL